MDASANFSRRGHGSNEFWSCSGDAMEVENNVENGVQVLTEQTQQEHGQRPRITTR